MKELVLDISVWDEGIDLAAWQKKHGLWAVIIKAGGNEGGRYRDRLFESHYEQAKSLGLHVGVYYYTTVTSTSAAKADAKHLVSLLDGKELDMPVYMDVEDQRQYALGKRALTDVIIAFCDAIESRGYKPGMYVNGNCWQNYVYSSELEKYANWIAVWSSNRPSYALDAGMWQQGTMNYDGTVHYADVSGCHDLDWCFIDYPSQIAGSTSATKEDTTGKLLKREIAAQVCEHICEDDRFGYSQPNRAGDGGTTTITLSDGSKVKVHTWDYDCSELVRMCYEAAGVLGGYWDSYMWTGNQDEVLTSHGFQRVSLSDVVRGDALWRSGHTALYLGNGKIGEAHHGDYAGGLSGRQGDQDGTEVRVATYYRSAWTTAYHYPESGDAAASEEASTSWEVFDLSQTVTVRCATLHIRTSPNAHRTDNIVNATYSKGETINLDGVVIADGYCWGTYIGSSSGKRRYVALGTAELAR